MRIINIIELNSGMIDNIESFIVFESEHTKKPEAVEEAEKRFTELAVAHGCKEEDIEASIDNASFDNMGGYEVLISWSNKVNT